MMNKKRIILAFGTRPEAIKMAPLVHTLRKQADHFDISVCVTAQHRQMLDQVLKSFEIAPDIDLNVMESGQDLFDVTTKVMLGMRAVFTRIQPDIVLVHGDTTTTLATSVAAFYSGIAIGHVEAGLRTHNIYNPFPEEFNRLVCSKLARWHFAPTELSRANLLAEGISDANIRVTGNTVIDALFWVLNRIESDERKSKMLTQSLNHLLNFDWKSDPFVLITGHRRESFGFGFYQICQAIRELAHKFHGVRFVYPVHLNPNVQDPVHSILSDLSNVYLLDPLDYEPFVYLLKHSYLVLTDSGGIQEEAPSLGKPVLVMRDVTERPEAINAGTVELVGSNTKKIVSSVSRLLQDKVNYSRMSHAHNPYGDGEACDRICNILKQI